MSRRVGVLVSAVVALLGSILVLFIAALAVASLYVETPQPSPPGARGSLIGAAVMFAVFGGLGIWTSVGLFRRRPWARTAILVFAGFLAVGCVFGLLVTMLVPLPPDINPATRQVVRMTTRLMFGIPFLIGVWWLVQFNMRSTKAAFVPVAREPESRRPLSVTIIAWSSIIGGVFFLFPILSRLPAFLFGATFTGWTAELIYIVFAAVSLYIGKGLLDLQEETRLVAIGWYAFSLVHMAVLTLVPSVREKTFEAQKSFAPDQSNPIPFDQGMLLNVTVLFSAMLFVTMIWFLARNRPAFQGTLKARGAT